MALRPNSRITAEVAGIVSPINFAGMANDVARVTYIRDLIIAEEASGADLQARMYLDEMSPLCRNALYVILTKCIASVT